MHLQYNTPPYRKLYRSYIERYDNCDKVVNIEPRVREFSHLIRQSGLGVSVWSCEGHEEDTYSPYEGYVMLTARNREAAAKLVDVFQKISSVLVTVMGWEALPEIESPLASLGEDTSYPCVVIRSPSFTKESNANLFWEIVTVQTEKLLKHHISANPENITGVIP
ncbi:hypothetical protein ST201phi2-1p007 [Pseudomonas phage 201phi2-1]|uniref:Uncharacterized protein n=1 Tax=Pseudomonas phage 201phi2-1 TaxID=198110 RepID=B3FJY3_BP201|nr:hypothetical protein ST201phi2-1p007 [Pseudomonas phage 201phi2-1]ABY62841.1 hypothetical protein 201phi2-1p007 [Pseudomonas phage 201phi2-1]